MAVDASMGQRVAKESTDGDAAQTVPTTPCSSNASHIVRIWAVSDIHTDDKNNMQWIKNLSEVEYKRDALIVAGDISDEIEVLERTLRVLVEKFGKVFFTPGNHDLWLTNHDCGMDSLEKLHKILDLCQTLGVMTRPCRIGPAVAGSGAAAWVCPLLSWHHQSFDTEPDIEGWAIPSAERVMCDYHNCRFPAPLSMSDDSVAAAIDTLNDDNIQALRDRPRCEPLITFSHFLPRLDLLLEKRFLLVPQLPKASGSCFLEARLRQLGAEAHVFGHTHFGWDAMHDGVRYMQAALAQPSERLARWHTLKVGDFGLNGPLLIWSSASGFAAKMTCRWSGYYEHHAREPHRVFELAQYAAGQYQRTDPRASTCEPDFSHEGSDGRPAGNRRLPKDPVLAG